MVTKKGEKRSGHWLMEELRRLDERAPIVDTKWSVVEVTPGYNTGGYYDQDIPENVVIVSPFLDSREEAEAWRDEHEPDEGKSLELVKHVAREHKYVQWTSTKVKG